MPNNLASRIQTILTDAFTFFVGNFRQIAAMCLPFLFAVALFQVALEQAYPASAMAFLSSVALGAVIYPIYMGALIRLMASRARQERPTSSALITAAIPQWSRLLTLKIVASFMILVGFGLVVVPGLWMWGRLAFAEFYLVLYGISPREALQRSLMATRGHLSVILTLLFLTNVPLLMLGVTVEQAFAAQMSNPLVQLFFTTGLGALELFVHVALFRAFMDVVAGPRRPAADST
jgi:hypothetical protein